jgi:dipeptidyl aminopeptidase/acylaminoacyl peptidase
MDDNVAPATTMQLVDALIKGNKDFDFLMVPGMGHSSGGNMANAKDVTFL